MFVRSGSAAESILGRIRDPAPPRQCSFDRAGFSKIGRGLLDNRFRSASALDLFCRMHGGEAEPPAGHAGRHPRTKGRVMLGLGQGHHPQYRSPSSGERSETLRASCRQGRSILGARSCIRSSRSRCRSSADDESGPRTMGPPPLHLTRLSPRESLIRPRPSLVSGSILRMLYPPGEVRLEKIRRT